MYLLRGMSNTLKVGFFFKALRKRPKKMRFDVALNQDYAESTAATNQVL